MKRQIRQGVFETNSSSVHTLTMCTNEEYVKWTNGELMYDSYSDKLVDVKLEITEQDKKNAKAYYEDSKKNFWKEWSQLSVEETNEWYKKYMSDYKKFDSERYNTYEEFFDNEYCETFEQSYTTPSGEKIIAFGYYGYDG